MSKRVPDISVLIVNWNTRELIERCLDSLPAGVGAGRTFETIVVDNASTDGSLDVLAARSDIDLFQNDRNLGFAAAVNQSCRESRAPLVLLLNPDVVVRPGSVGALAELLDARPELAGAAPLYQNPDGTFEPFHFRFPTFSVLLANSSAPFRRLPGMQQRLRSFQMLDVDFSRPRRVPQPSASCLLLRREHLEPDGIFDERYPIFFNDVQLARSLAAKGRELWVTPEAVVVHDGHASTRQLGPALKRQYVGSLVRMLTETGPRRNAAAYRAVVLVQGLVLLLLRRPGAMSLRDLVAAASGDPGPLPARPVADT